MKNTLPLELKYCTMEIYRKEQDLIPLLNEVNNQAISACQLKVDELLKGASNDAR